MVNETNLMTLRDGRRLCYAVYNRAEVSRTAFGFNGTPNSRLSGGPPPDVQLRVITMDRPGYGQSDPKPDLTLLDCAEDTLELADHLGVERFPVAGVSGGGPYALACAYLAPERVTRVILSGSVAPMGIVRMREAAKWPQRLSYRLVKYAPWLLDLIVPLPVWLVRHGIVRRLWAKWIAARSGAPGQHERNFRYLEEAFRNGSRGYLADVKIHCRPWGFSLTDIKVETHVFHGVGDRMAPVAWGEHLAETIPGAQGHFYDETGHAIVGPMAEEFFAVLAS